MKTFLGVDGGGSKTEFVLIDEAGAVRARHRGGSAYHPEIGVEGLEQLVREGVSRVLADGGVTASELTYAFLGIPAYGEDSGLTARLDAAAAPVLARERTRCGNDMVCGWAGALACAEGISVVAGTGSIAYGEWGGRSARAGGWGELFSDEGSAYWVAREGLNLFSRMSDGRAPRGPLHARVRAHFALQDDLDLCAVIYAPGAAWRSRVAQLAGLVAEAAREGDAQARGIHVAAAGELAAQVHAVRERLRVPEGTFLPVSYSGGMFAQVPELAGMLEAALQARAAGAYRVMQPVLPPALGAALYAARCAGYPLDAAAVRRLGAGT